MTYKEWSDQYYESAENLRRQIEELTLKMKAASGEILTEMSKRVELMRIMRYECLGTAKLLGGRKGEC